MIEDVITVVGLVCILLAAFGLGWFSKRASTGPKVDTEQAGRTVMLDVNGHPELFVVSQTLHTPRGTTVELVDLQTYLKETRSWPT